MSSRFPKAARVVALGDVHGDLLAARVALRLAGAIDEADAWIGGELVVVQTGDQLDRGDDEQEIIDLFDRLVVGAQAAGGAFHVLNGNHEYMNAMGDLRYVTPGGFADFEDASGLELDDPKLARLPSEARARAAAFLPGGPYARKLAHRNTAVVVGDTVFVHGGIEPKYAGRIDELNAAGRSWLWGAQPDGAAPPAALVAMDGLVWSRRYSDETVDAADCTSLGETLATIGATRMVVGHTVQQEGITSACDERVWRVDVGMAKHYGGQPAVLEIKPTGVTVLRPQAPKHGDPTP